MEYRRDLEVQHKVEVFVAGGGPAGVAAARRGAEAEGMGALSLRMGGLDTGQLRDALREGGA